ncbi:MAG: three-Cys-motif partner protein TcmP [Candidatus Methanoperedens sp.]
MVSRDHKNDFEWLKDRIEYLQPKKNIISCHNKCYEVGMWSPLKTVLLSYYYSIFTGIASRHTKNMIYIDLLSGSGIVDVRGEFKIIGSPLAAIYFARQPFSKMFLAERDELAREALEKRLRIVMQEQKLDFEKIVDKIYPNANMAGEAAIEYMNGKLRKKENVLNLCLIDYEGFKEVPFDLIKRISNFFGDTIINYQTHQLARVINDQNADYLTSFFGTEQWKAYSSANYKETLKLYQSQLMKNRPIFVPIEIKSGSPYYYHLIFTCRETSSGSKWMDAIRNIKPKIEASDAGTVEDIIDIIKGNQRQLTDF